MATGALVLWGIYYAVALGARVALHKRATGSTGLVAGRGVASPAQAAGELAELAALGLAIAAPVLDLAGIAEPIDALDGTAGHAIGAFLFVVGFAGIIWSQQTMGSAWRIGVDAGAHTNLVTAGPFALVRNPIFSCLVAVVAGSALMVPSVVAVAAFVLIMVSVEVQARFVEEPYLLRSHGSAYSAYARRAGRFVPGVGRLRAGSPG